VALMDYNKVSRPSAYYYEDVYDSYYCAEYECGLSVQYGYFDYTLNNVEYREATPAKSSYLGVGERLDIKAKVEFSEWIPGLIEEGNDRIKTLLITILK
jgi:hypothetical protein